MNQCKSFDSDEPDELSNSSDDNSDEDINIHIKKTTFRNIGLYMYNLSQSIDSYSSDESDEEHKREIFTKIGIYMHEISCEKTTCYKPMMEKVFKELLTHFKNYISDSESELFFYLSEEEA